jgi:prepilin-type N-terminal cleavage/methylation domain
MLETVNSSRAEFVMRSPHHHNFKSQRGVTLIELLVVIVIIAVVSAFALMQRGKSNEQFQRQNIARQLKVASNAPASTP